MGREAEGGVGAWREGLSSRSNCSGDSPGAVYKTDRSQINTITQAGLG